MTKLEGKASLKVLISPNLEQVLEIVGEEKIKYIASLINCEPQNILLWMLHSTDINLLLHDMTGKPSIILCTFPSM